MNSETPDTTPAANQGLASQCPTAVAAHTAEVDALAQFIRAVDGDNRMGAGELAERIFDWLCENYEATKGGNVELIAAARLAQRALLGYRTTGEAMVALSAALAKVTP